MNKTLILLVILMLVLGSILFFTQEAGQQHVTNFEDCVAAGNPVMESYPRQCRHGEVTYTETITSSVGQVCRASTDCAVPMEYAVQSNCPYEAFCQDGACVVACPLWEHAPNPDESISYSVACTTSNDCNCSAWDRDDRYPCACLDGRCASVVDQ